MADEEKVAGVQEISADAHFRDKDYVTFYSDFAQVGLTPWNIRLQFGQLGEPEPGVHGIVEMATVTMTPAFAKAVVNVLAQNIKIYEQQNGEIEIPRTVLEAGKSRRSPSASVSPSASACPSAPAEPENEG